MDIYIAMLRFVAWTVGFHAKEHSYKGFTLVKTQLSALREFIDWNSLALKLVLVRHFCNDTLAEYFDVPFSDHT